MTTARSQPPSEAMLAKARRLVETDNVHPSKDPTHWWVTGDHGEYHVNYDGNGAYRCTCPSQRDECAHILAVKWSVTIIERTEKEQTMPETPAVQMVTVASPQALAQRRDDPDEAAWEQMCKMAKVMANSGAFKKRRPVGEDANGKAIWKEAPVPWEDLLLIGLSGHALGLPFASSLRHLSLINGALCTSAELMRAKLHEFGYGYRIETNADSARVTVWHRSRPAETNNATYSMAEAKQAELIKAGGGWTKNPQDMLVARATARAVRRFAPEVMDKTYLQEELLERTSMAQVSSVVGARIVGDLDGLLPEGELPFGDDDDLDAPAATPGTVAPLEDPEEIRDAEITEEPEAAPTGPTPVFNPDGTFADPLDEEALNGSAGMFRARLRDLGFTGDAQDGLREPAGVGPVDWKDMSRTERSQMLTTAYAQRQQAGG